MATRMKIFGLGAVASLALAGLTAGAAPGHASALAVGVVSLNLQLDEAAGSTVARDSSGLSHNGAVGSHVKMNGSYAALDRHAPDEGISYGLAHLIKVNDAADGSLDPGSGTFTVELRYRSTVSFGNVIQKGQATSTGGQVKLQQPKGIVGCLFKSPTGQVAVNSKTPLNDGQWHVVRCVRTATDLSMYVDGALRSHASKPSGTINNTKPWTIGGKSSCNGSTVTCDYFAGDIDYVKLTKG